MVACGAAYHWQPSEIKALGLRELFFAYGEALRAQRELQRATRAVGRGR